MCSGTLLLSLLAAPSNACAIFTGFHFCWRFLKCIFIWLQIAVVKTWKWTPNLLNLRWVNWQKDQRSWAWKILDAAFIKNRFFLSSFNESDCIFGKGCAGIGEPTFSPEWCRILALEECIGSCQIQSPVWCYSPNLSIPEGEVLQSAVGPILWGRDQRFPP